MVVQCYVDSTGKVTEVAILKGIPYTGLNEAAMTGVKRTVFNPAKRGDKAVGVRISLPITFRITPGTYEKDYEWDRWPRKRPLYLIQN